MALTTLESTVLNYSSQGYKQPRESEIAGATPYVTGNRIMDHFLHHMTLDHGIKVHVKEGAIYRRIERVEIVDEVKAAWFLLKHGA